MSEQTTSADAAARGVQRARRFGEMQSLIRGLVFGWPGPSDAPEVQAARHWLSSHCRACGVALEGAKRRELCGACAAEFAQARPKAKG